MHSIRSKSNVQRSGSITKESKYGATLKAQNSEKSVDNKKMVNAIKTFKKPLKKEINLDQESEKGDKNGKVKPKKDDISHSTIAGNKSTKNSTKNDFSLTKKKEKSVDESSKDPEKKSKVEKKTAEKEKTPTSNDKVSNDKFKSKIEKSEKKVVEPKATPVTTKSKPSGKIADISKDSTAKKEKKPAFTPSEKKKPSTVTKGKKDTKGK